MSTYAVFGMTMSRARENASKIVEPYNVKLRRQKTLDELTAEIAAKVDEIMASTRCVQVSDTFDAPQFADEFLRLTKLQQPSRSLHIKAHCFTGELDPKTKKPIRKWVEVGTPEEQQIKDRLKAGTLL